MTGTTPWVKRRTLRNLVFLLITSFGTLIIACSNSSESKSEAVYNTVQSDPFIEALLKRADAKLPKIKEFPTFELRLRFATRLTDNEVSIWSTAELDGTWSSPAAGTWTRSAEVLYGGGGSNESQVRCFLELSVELSGENQSYSSGVILVNHPITPDSCV
jgi:hypothetical protein